MSSTLGGEKPSTFPRYLVEKEALLVLGVALAARLVFLLLQDPLALYEGGDGPYYVRQAWLLANGRLEHPLTTAGPLYPLFLATVWLAFPSAPMPDAAGVPLGFLFIVRLGKVLASGWTVLLVYGLVRQLGVGRRSGMLAALAVGLGPAFVIEPFYLRTETFFVLLLTAACWLYLRAQREASIARLAASGAVLGLATLTRPVALPLVLLLGGHWLMTHGRRSGRAQIAALLAGLLVIIVPWVAYLRAETAYFTPEGFGSNLWIGASGDGTWQGTFPTAERSLAFGGTRDDYLPEVARLIGSDPLGWLRLRSGNLAQAVLVPHGVNDIGGPSLKVLAAAWAQADRSWTGLLAIIGLPSFVPKLIIYLFHMAALGLGVLGLVSFWPAWRTAGPVMLIPAYFLLVHFFLTAQPRYLFPAEAFLWVLAGGAVQRLMERRATVIGPVSAD